MSEITPELSYQFEVDQFILEVEETVADIGEDRQTYIRETLIPMMDEHRGRDQPAAAIVIAEKIFGVDQGKPGEMMEFMNVIQHSLRLTPEKALEIADLIYYMEQPNGRCFLYSSRQGYQTVAPETQNLAEPTLGVSLDRARLFCIVKYLTRMRFNHFADDKREQAEKTVIAQFLEDDMS